MAFDTVHSRPRLFPPHRTLCAFFFPNTFYSHALACGLDPFTNSGVHATHKRVPNTVHYQAAGNPIWWRAARPSAGVDFIGRHRNIAQWFHACTPEVSHPLHNPCPHEGTLNESQWQTVHALLFLLGAKVVETG